MNKLDPFEGDEDGSDGENVPPAPVTELASLPQQQEPQAQVHISIHSLVKSMELSVSVSISWFN